MSVQDCSGSMKPELCGTKSDISSLIDLLCIDLVSFICFFNLWLQQKPFPFLFLV